MAFHVPEAARLTSHPMLGTTAADGNNGAFYLESCEPGWQLALICSDASDAAALGISRWEHVSVHAFRDRAGRTQRRTPTWREMCQAKECCWDAEDVVMQLHPRRSQYVNLHPHTLHLWRRIDQVIPEPEAIMVGPPVLTGGGA